jgi:hypothetical protein
MAEYVKWLFWNEYTLEIFPVSSPCDDYGFKRIIRIQRYDNTVSNFTYTVTTPSYALDESGNLSRTHVLNHQINATNVQAEFKAGCTDESLQLTFFQTLFGNESRGLRQ